MASAAGCASRVSVGGSSAWSWRRIAASSSASARPGSIPSSSTSDGSCRPVDGERVSLAPGAVEREHELTAKALAQRLGADQGLELSDELRVAPEREVGLDPLLESAPA